MKIEISDEAISEAFAERMTQIARSAAIDALHTVRPNVLAALRRAADAALNSPELVARIAEAIRQGMVAGAEEEGRRLGAKIARRQAAQLDLPPAEGT